MILKRNGIHIKKYSGLSGVFFIDDIDNQFIS